MKFEEVKEKVCSDEEWKEDEDEFGCRFVGGMYDDRVRDVKWNSGEEKS